ncbi:MAG: co-chaperone GroES [Clostridia bacterium]|jgi:chaperonin GroES|nr:co-chaperone GroES [Clostridia bacterium]
MKIKPLFDRVVLLPIENESETKGGILLPMAAQEKSQLATVVAVGSGENVDGKQIGMQVKVGDKVLYGKFTGTEITVDEVKYVVIRQPDILAIIE